MKKTSVWKKLSVLMLSGILFAGSMNMASVEAAADTTAPSAATYATADQVAEPAPEGGEVAFASAAPAATQTTAMNADGSKVVRVSGGSTIASTVVFDADSATVTKSEADEGLYLYVQGNNGSDWVYSIPVTAGVTLDATSVQAALALSETPDLTKCKVWIEKLNPAIGKPAAVSGTYAENPVAAVPVEQPVASPAPEEQPVALATTPDEPIAVTDVALDKTTLELNVAETSKLTATVMPENATDKTVAWTSSDANVATVAEDGTVTAVAAGTATITVTTTDGEKTATCVVNVTKPVVHVESIALDKTTITMNKAGATEKITVSVTPVDADNKTVTWSSTDTNVATVAADGTVTAVADGKATIIAASVDGGKTAMCNVTVATATETPTPTPTETPTPTPVPTPTNKKVSATSNYTDECITSEMKKAGYDTAEKVKSKLESEVEAVDSAYVADNTKLYDINYKVSFDNGSTWTVDDGTYFPKSGLTMTLPYPENTNKTDYKFTLVHMVSHDGTSEKGAYKVGEIEKPELTLNDNGIQFKLYSLSPVMVAWKSATDKPSATAIKLNKTAITFTKTGSNYTLEATITPSSADQTVTWKSSDEEVATVDKDGRVTSKSKGSCTVTATSKANPKLSASCKVTVSSNTPASGGSSSRSSGGSTSSSKAKNAKTGDSFHGTPYIIVIICAVAVIAGVLVAKKRKSNK